MYRSLKNNKGIYALYLFIYILELIIALKRITAVRYHDAMLQ